MRAGNEPSAGGPQAEKLLQAVLKEAGDATNWSVSLAPHKISQDLVSQMRSRGQFMWKMYANLQRLVLHGKDTEADYAECFTSIERAMAWYATRCKAGV